MLAAAKPAAKGVPRGGASTPFLDRTFQTSVCFVNFAPCAQGVIVYFRIVDGEIRRGDKIKFMANGVEREVSVRCR